MERAESVPFGKWFSEWALWVCFVKTAFLGSLQGFGIGADVCARWRCAFRLAGGLRSGRRGFVLQKLCFWQCQAGWVLEVRVARCRIGFVGLDFGRFGDAFFIFFAILRFFSFLGWAAFWFVPFC